MSRTKATSDDPRYVRSYLALAEALGVTRQAVEKWRRNPALRGAIPKRRVDSRYDVEEWRAFCAAHDLKGKPVSEEQLPDDDTQAEWKRRKLRADALRSEIELERVQGRLIPVETYERGFADLWATVDGEVRRMLGSDLPPELEGLEAKAIATRCLREWDRMCEDFRARGEAIKLEGVE